MGAWWKKIDSRVPDDVQPPRPSCWACPVRSRPGRLNMYGLGPSRILSLMLSAERSWSELQQEPATVCQPAPILPRACPG